MIARATAAFAFPDFLLHGRSAVVAMAQSLAAHARDRRDRARLESFDDHLLADVGLARDRHTGAIVRLKP